jgi:ribonuclease D
MSTARQGKIARLPANIREEINLRLLNGEKGAKILIWLNGMAEVKSVLEEDFEGLHVNDDNLSAWRTGGYADWLKKRERLDQVREMSEWSIKLAKAGGASMSEGAAAILAGNILELLEEIRDLAKVVGEEGKESSAEKLAAMGKMTADLTLAVSRLRKGDHSAEALRLARERLDQTGEELKLAQEKFQRETLALFLKWHEDKRVKEIISGDDSNDTKTEQLGQTIFGEDWK